MTLSADALDIRDYIPARHDRFVTSADGLEINPQAYYGAAAYAAVGFGINPGDVRQFALVTPEHVLFAKHYAFGGTIRFINSDGAALNRAIGATTDVPNGSGGISDLIILKLSAPVTEAEKIAPFPYMNLANEAAYNGTVLTTFGQPLRGGRGTLTSFSNYSQTGPPAIGTTRTFIFRHSVLTGNADDAVAIRMDSGSPTFAIANGRPALMGVHLAASSGTFNNSTTDTFVPHYAETVNGLLAPDGYQLIPAFPKTVTLSTAVTNAPLLQASAGSIDLTLSNTDPDTATNVRVELEFPPAAIPTSVSAPGWIVGNPSPGIFKLRTATLAGNSSATLTASYASVPIVSEISLDVLQRSDGSPQLSETYTSTVRETFAGFVSSLPLKGESDDPDLDGFGNLLEYAFGGNPSENSGTAFGGYPLAPIFSREDGAVSYSFARRTDAIERGLQYEIEFSETLEEDSWSISATPDFSITTMPFNPSLTEFEKVTASLPSNGENKRFLRVKVTLNE